MPPTHLDHLRVLERWPRLAEQYWYDDPRRPSLGCFGTGYNSWGVQTNQKFIGAFAVLAADPATDEHVTGCSREALLDRALRALRFSLASHLSGDHTCTDGTQWGHTWISALGVERMMHGLEAIENQLTESDREAVRRVLCSEADWLLHLTTQGTLWAKDGGNKPESNIWNGAICARAAALAPEHPHAADWIEKCHLNLLNGLSIPADANDKTVIAGKPLRDWHVGPNFFPHYALDHHGYLNVGYMVICLSNLAMLHYSFVLQGLQPPESLYLHAHDLWEVVRLFIFDNGRLARLGGDSRQRYCYCQDYLLPTLLLAHEALGDDSAAALEAGNLELIRAEQAFNADGSFLSQRLQTMRATNPYYYARLESDKAVVLSMNAYWRRKLVAEAGGLAPRLPSLPSGDALRPPACAWQEDEHGAIMHRSPRRLASWSWHAWDAPQGLCLPPEDGHLAEWSENLGGRVLLAGEQGKRTVVTHRQCSFEGGFVTSGTMADSTKAYFGEGWTSSEPALHQLAVAALPDDRTMVVLEHCRLGTRTYLNEVKGLKLNVPNDLFNGFSRDYLSLDGARQVDGRGEGVTELASPYVNLEDIIGVVNVYGAEGVTLYQAGRRRASGYADSLYYDEVCCPCRVGLWDVPPGTVVLDCGNVVLSGATAGETRDVAEHCLTPATDTPDVRALIVPGAGRYDYMVVANFGETQDYVEFQLPPRTAAVVDLVSRHDWWREGDAVGLRLEHGECRVAEVIR